jgi:peptidoglycan/xylan/chitin deacetylase (PgdA/CDA1 family)
MFLYFSPGNRKRAAVALSFILIVIGARLGIGMSHQQHETAARIKPITSVETNSPQIAAIVDVSSEASDQIQAALETLQECNISATWFVSATFAEANSFIIDQITGSGHELGIKGTDDKAMNKLDEIQVKDRILRSRQTLSNLNVEIAPFIYPPSAKFSDTLINTAFMEGFYPVKGNIDGSSLKGKPEKAAEKVGSNTKPGDILLLKITKKGLVPAKQYLVEYSGYLSRHGLSVVTLSSLVKSVE